VNEYTVDSLHESLTHLPDVYALLALFRLPGSRPVDPEKIQGTQSPARPPLALDVLDLEDERTKHDSDPQRLDYDLDRRAGARRQGIRPTLAAWVCLADGELWDNNIPHVSPCANPPVFGACSFLLEHLEWITAQKWAADIAADVGAMLADAKRIVGDEKPAARKCPECYWPVEPRDNEAWFSCTGCRKTWVMHNEVAKLNAQQDNSLPLSACASDVSRPVPTLKEWKSRGWIAPIGKDHRGYLYDIIKVRETANSIKHGKRVTA
jgi:hypothetical protein